MIRSTKRKVFASTQAAVSNANPLMEGLEGRQLMSATYLSDMTPTSATNGWGQYEKDMSNGEQAAGDGKKLSIGGKQFDKGLGVHAGSTLTYNLDGKYDQFKASVGVDGEVYGGGSVVFQAYLDGVKVYDSGTMVGKQAAKDVSLNTAGKKELKLVVTDAGNGAGLDHADWADAQLIPSPTTTYLSDMTPTSAVNGWGPYEKDKSNGEQAAGDGKKLSIGGVTYDKGLGVHAGSTLTYNLNGQYDQFDATVGVDGEVYGGGSVVFQAYLDGAKVYDSGTMVGKQAGKNVSLNTTGKKELKLVVTDAGNGAGLDHADWANARLTSNGSTTPTNPTDPTPTAPTAPTTLTATAASTSQINLAWKDNASDETGFKIERSTDGTNFTQIATVGANVTSFQSTGLTAGTKYYYRVRATNTAGDSSYTSVANATTQAATPTAPTAPTTLTATAASTSQINLSWKDNASNETGYKIERSTNGTSFTQVGLVGANVTSFQDTGLTAGTKYYYRVRATNTGGDSAYTSVVNATTQSSTTPSTGSKPTAANTGPTNESILKSSGSITVNTAGSVIENVNVNGTIYVNASNVTIRNFKINSSGAYAIQVADGVSNVVIEDGEITGTHTAAIYGPGWTARRLEIHHTGGDALKPWSNVVIDGNYIHHLGMDSGSHADGIQASGGSNITITNNNIDMPEHNEGGQTYLSNAAIFIHTYFGGISNIKIDNNWLNGGNYTIYSIDAKTGYGNPTGVSMTNNKFGRDYNYGTRNTTGSVVWSGNTWQDNGAVIS